MTNPNPAPPVVNAKTAARHPAPAPEQPSARHLIHQGRSTPDIREWLLDADAPLPDEAPRRPLILPLARWRALGPALRSPQWGVWLGPADDPELLLPDLPTLPLVAVHFPAFTDGRGYTIARLLRSRYCYRGELRAFGDVLRDQVYFLARCGFDALQLRADQSPEAALQALGDYSWEPLQGLAHHGG
jgi:uncharacterized protein (DUF934 family)